MRQIPVPNWARPFEIDIENGFGEQEYNRIVSHRVETLGLVQKAIEQYVNDDELVFTTIQSLFPQRDKLTGEYYIGNESYQIYTEQRPPARGKREWHFSIMARCLEKPWHENQSDYDYLGLEVHFHWHPAEQEIVFYGDIDSSSI